MQFSAVKKKDFVAGNGWLPQFKNSLEIVSKTVMEKVHRKKLSNRKIVEKQRKLNCTVKNFLCLQY